MNIKSTSKPSTAKLVKAPSGQMRPVVKQTQKSRGSNRNTQGAASAALEISAEVRLDAESYLQDITGDEGYPSLDKIAQKDWLKARLTQVNKQRRSQHIRALSDAYAMYVMVKSDPSFRQSIMQTAKDIGKHSDDNTDELRTIVELHMVYDGDGSQSDTKKSNALYSRDVNAIKGLIYSKILPSNVPSLSKEKGQGLDFWSRSGRKRSYSKPKKETDKKYNAPPLSNGSAADDMGKMPEEQNPTKLLKTIELEYKLTKPGRQKTILTWRDLGVNGQGREHYSIVCSSAFDQLIDAFCEKLEELNIPTTNQ